ncbi:hypothetical protein FKR81_15655 [Lentzea tibetensis]|uniref:Septum formation-related domain-containing protein n=1 Tax=Lentzea tibetensis TaxID=2591470 RepID=A0A563EVD6_9PSEU|nr:hypothetical protein FKR81_15655 [Lentzea tibetensis]
MVMVGALAGAFVLLLVSAFTSVLGTGGPLGRGREAVNAAYESNAGDCLNWSKDLADAQKVECGKQHKFEVTGAANLEATYPKDAPFPDGTLWQKIVQDNCVQTSLNYLSNKFDPHGKYSVGSLNPDEKRWINGDRSVRCGVQVSAPSGALLPSFGSAKTADQSDVFDPTVCLGITQTGDVGDPIECAQPHAFEIVGVVDLNVALPGDFPPVDKQEGAMSAQCATITAEYTGGADLKAKGLLVTWDTRLAESWAVGSRKANCKIGAVPVNGKLAPWTGSVRNPNAPPITPSNPPQTTSVRPQDEPTGAPLHSESGQPPSSSQPPSSGLQVPTLRPSTETSATP